MLALNEWLPGACVALKTFVGLISLLSVLCSPAIAAETDLHSIELHPGKELRFLVNDRTQGKFNVLVCSTGMKISSQINGGEGMACAPDWKVVCFRRNEKIQWVAPMDRFSCDSINPLEFSPQTDVRRIRLPKNLLKVKCNGVDCVTLHTRTLGATETYWFAETNLSDKILEFYDRFFAIPHTGKLCMKCDARSIKQQVPPPAKRNSALQHWGMFDDVIKANVKDGAQVEILKIEEVPLQPKEFEYPQGYQTKRNLLEVMSRGGSEGVADMIDGVMAAPPPTPRK